MTFDPDDYEFFWDGICSQWHPSHFALEGRVWNCAEQYMMYKKAELFADKEAMDGVLSSSSPRIQKAWGRKVKNFDGSKWNEISRLVVYRGNLAKFSQNADLWKYLYNTRDKIIVEASPEDAIWGIGLDTMDALKSDPSKWPGKNWLGIACMQVREDLSMMVENGIIFRE